MAGLNILDVSYKYKKNQFSLRNINIAGQSGDVICLLGPSGCGKSTILKLVAGLEQLDSGSIFINNRVVVNNNVFIPAEKRNVGLIFQHPSLFPHQTIVENVMFAMKNLPKSKKYDLAMEILHSVNMAHYKDSYPCMLSGGQQQLITIARAIAQRPEIILLDEPFSSLDTVLKRKTRNHVLSLLKKDGIITILVTHDPEEALEVADSIYVMRDGNIIQYGTPHEIYYNPKDHILAQFFGEINHFKAVVKQNYIESPFGKIPAHNFHNNDRVVVCIRPETILFSQDSNVKAVIEDIRFFNNMVYISVGGATYWMKFPVTLLPKKGDIIPISLDLDKILLFKF